MSPLPPPPGLVTQQSSRNVNHPDIAYMYAVPLVKKDNGHEYSMGLPIDYQTEIDELQCALCESNKEVLLRIEPASIDSLN